jgi:N utilization substance protein A
VRQVVNELRGEKVDIVEFRADLKQFIAEALSPAKVRQVILDDENKEATVIVPDHQLSLAIGKEGQNARLAARLSGYRIDIRPETPGPGAWCRLPRGAGRHRACGSGCGARWRGRARPRARSGADARGLAPFAAVAQWSVPPL